MRTLMRAGEMRAGYLELLNDGVVLVTPARRMAGLIADRYHAAMLDAGRMTWEAPAVLPFGAWLTDTFETLALSANANAAGGILLSVEQERAVWEQVVRECGDTEAAKVETLAALAMSAWSTALLWDLPIDAIAGAAGRQEVSAFLRWAGRFEQRCSDLDAIDQHRFAARLAASGSAVSGVLPRFEFFGYPRLPTLLTRIARRSEAAGRVEAEPAPASGTAFECRAFANGEIELKAAMTWAGEQKLRRPQASVMVVLAGVSRVDPDLHQRLRRAFSAAHGGESGVPGAQLCSPTAESLADIPLVQSALLILDRRRVRPWDEISRLLLSPYLGEADAECGQRAMLDYQLRRSGDVDVSINSVIDAARSGHTPCPHLAERISSWMSMHQAMPSRAPMHEWMRYAEDLLDAAGWPGERGLNGPEQRALAEWHRVMDATAQLDAVTPSCSWQLAFGKWRAILRARQLSPDTDVNAVQVVTLDEAAWVDADALWVTGLHDGAWPRPVEVNPLLPFALQREHGLPGVDPERELIHGERVLGRVNARHPTVIWSYAAVEGETPRRPLMGAVCLPVPSSVSAAWPRGRAGARFDISDDTYALKPGADAALGGGVALFTDQAACPFRALARHRLAAGAPPDASPGLDGRQRGRLIHELMAAFWRRVNSSARLAAAGEDEIQQVLAACATEVVDRFRVRYRLLDAYWELERERLSDLGREWLRLEQGRGEFEVIACEQTQAVQVGAYTINTRIDRIDRLANGDVLIIDYKTGEVPRSGWSVPRPDQPQLPLYVVGTGAERVAGIAYARVKKGACKVVDEPSGIVRDGVVATDGASAWTLHKDEWRIALTGLADEIGSGFALADPKRSAATCRRCDLQCLCRIHESQPAVAADDED